VPAGRPPGAGGNLESRPSTSIPFSGAITHPLSINPPKTWVGLACLAAFGFMLLGLARGIGGRDLRVLAPGLVALGVLMSMIGIIQKALWSGKVYGFWEPVNKGVVAFGPFINRNHFAGWMLLALPVAVGYFASQVAKGMVGVKPGWRNRVIWFSTPDASRAVLTGFAILVMGFALTLTLSRSGIGCFLLAVVLSAFNVVRRQQSATKGRLVGTYLALVFVAAVAWVGIDAIGARFAQVDWKLGGRAGAWADAWRIHEAFPWFGTGLNTYGSATLLLQQFEKATAHYVEAHNDYLQLLVEGGWLVAAPALLLLGLFVREVRRRFREGRDDRTGYWIRLGAVTGLVAIAFQEIVEFSLQMPGNAALFCVLMALAAGRLPHRKKGPRLRAEVSGQIQ
jgi:O-antigen ligase